MFPVKMFRFVLVAVVVIIALSTAIAVIRASMAGVI